MANKKYYGYVNKQGKWVYNWNYDNNNIVIPMTQFCDYATRYLIKKLGYTFSDPVDDARGIDAYTPDNKKVQLKIFLDNSPTVTFDFDFCKADNIHKNAHYIFKQALKKYCKQFDLFVIYIGKYRGEPLDLNKIIIMSSEEAYEWIIKHGHRAYMRYKGGERGYAQIHLRKTTCGDIEKIEIK